MRRDFANESWAAMSLLLIVVYVCAPLLLGLAAVAVLLNYTLQFLFRLLHIPNRATGSPSGFFSWRRLAAPDILFRLASLAALNLVLYWLPIYYWTTYTPSGDDRDGAVLFYALGFCPVSWVLGGLCYAQAWRIYQTVQYRAGFYAASSLFLLAVFSTLIPMIKLYARTT
jgi:hypothetical protein